MKEPLDDHHAIHLALDAGEEHARGAAARARVPLQARRVEDSAGEVPAERAPERAVAAGRDAVLVAEEVAVGEGGGRSVGEQRAALHESTMGRGAIGDEDGGLGRLEAEREDRAVAGADEPHDGAEVAPAQEEEQARGRQRRRAWWQLRRCRRRPSGAYPRRTEVQRNGGARGGREQAVEPVGVDE